MKIDSVVLSSEMVSPSTPYPPWISPDGARTELIQLQIARLHDHVSGQYQKSTLQFQMTWGLLASMLYKGFLVLLCRVSVLPFVFLCKLGRVDLSMVILRLGRLS